MENCPQSQKVERATKRSKEFKIQRFHTQTIKAHPKVTHLPPIKPLSTLNLEALLHPAVPMHGGTPPSRMSLHPRTSGYL